MSAEGLRGLLERPLPFRRLEEARIPLHVVATDLLTGRGVVLSRGAAIPALMASAAIPAVFPPVRIGGRDLIDGGVADYAPISQAVALGADRVYVLLAAHACALFSPPGSAVAMALHSLNLMIESRMAADVERLCDEVELHVLPHPCPLSVSPADFSHSGELIERARSTHRLSSRSSAIGARASQRVVLKGGDRYTSTSTERCDLSTRGSRRRLPSRLA